MEFDRIIKSHGAVSARKLLGIGVHVVELPVQMHGKEQALVQALSRNPHIKFAELDGVISMQQIPSDPYYGSAWHLPAIQAPGAWDLAVGDGVTIAVLDGGVDSSHPDLVQRIVQGWNAYDNNSNTSDVNGHGTKVAGVAAAAGNNGVGVTGSAWNSRIMPVRISDPSGAITYYSIVANGLTWAADHGARVANISYIVSDVATIQNAAQYMWNKGGIVFASAGNTGGYTSSADAKAIVTVAATDSANQRASWSAYGPIIDLAAPGVSIWTTTNGGGYGAVSGTSFSSPLAAGVGALILSASPGIQPSKVDAILKSTATDLGIAGRDDYYGFGLINAQAAVVAARASTGTIDTSSPSVSVVSPTTGSAVTGLTAVSVTAADNVGVSKVELYAGDTLIASDITAPYDFVWDSSKWAGTTVNLAAKAYDAAGNVALSQAASVSVSGASSGSSSTTTSTDATPPVVNIENPQEGTSINGTVTVTVSAADNASTPTVSLYIDGVLKATGTGRLSYKWNSRKASVGTHTIEAVARDAAGNTNSKAVHVAR